MPTGGDMGGSTAGEPRRLAPRRQERDGRVIRRRLSPGDALVITWLGAREVMVLIVAEAVPEAELAQAVRHAADHAQDWKEGAETTTVCRSKDCAGAVRLLGFDRCGSRVAGF
jgi:hypothetical protein